MGVDVVDGGWIDARIGQGDRRGARGLAAVAARLDHVIGVRCRAVAEQLGVGDRPAALGDLGRLKDQERGSLAHHEPVAADVERPRCVAGIVVVAER